MADELLGLFIQDSRERLDVVESGLLRLEQGDSDPETVNTLFRAIHTIKGDARVVELPHIEAFAHALEDLLDPLRASRQPPARSLLALLLAACGHLQRLLGRLETAGPLPDAGLESAGAALVERMRHHRDAAPETEDSGPARHEPAPARAEAPAGEGRHLRVSAERFDQVIDIVGELVVASAGAELLAQSLGQGPLAEANGAVARLVGALREAFLRMRMVPIGDTLNRYRRVVRELGGELGKPVQLSIEGGETELDKSVVERLADPLLHLLRNAVDHGIEAPQTRLALGKPLPGTIRLTARHDGGGVVIQVADDGAGLPRDKILERARQHGLLAADALPSDDDLYNFIFEPGFSTADQVTHLSGRGVGMDVVRREIREARGSIEVASEAGRGTCFTLRLPLTLAIIDGFLVRVGDAHFILPLEWVAECHGLEQSGLQGGFIQLRGEPLPAISLRRLFAVAGAAPARESVVVIRAGRQAAGVIVDRLEGEIQTVIKPLSSLFRHAQALRGASVLASGDLALLLDARQLLDLARQGEATGAAGAEQTP